ncbi:MAG TPA: hypothetical protein VGX25_04120 [Actinophytocola sp.]|uniref:hypothetical protein n=1 Tax=Actinophytocola sp. TaxID=1872138 RepID=UPI002DDCD86B|nr:hypothetical protein [Actinophytocola sp.]HEV2778565.1 hypothetical protein [Actinophytocola sp.]
MTPPIAFVDCETTGVHPGRRPWEIAIIRREPEGHEQTWLAQIEDIDLAEADPFGLRIGGFYERHWRFSRGKTDRDLTGTRILSEHSAAAAVEELTRGTHLVGIVPTFDGETFDAMLRRHRLIPAWHYHLIDVEALAVGYLHGRNALVADGRELEAIGLPWRSDDLSRACGVEPPSEQDRHTALGDALWAQRWYDAITAPESKGDQP